MYVLFSEYKRRSFTREKRKRGKAVTTGRESDTHPKLNLTMIDASPMETGPMTGTNIEKEALSPPPKQKKQSEHGAGQNATVC